MSAARPKRGRGAHRAAARRLRRRLRPGHDAFVQGELAADAERERARQLADEQRRQEEEDEAARRAALAPDVLRHALLRTLARTGLLDSLSEDERAAVNRLPDSDLPAALAVNALLTRAHEAGARLRLGTAS